MESLKDKVVVVTGGGSGIGRTTCLALAKHGAKVVLSDINLEEAQQTEKLIQSSYPRASTLSLKCDVSSAASVSSMIDKAVEKFGRIDLAVNNAGVFGKLCPTAEYPEALFDQQVGVNLKGVFLCLKYEISQIQKQDKATHYSIVNVSSIAGLSGFKGNSPYAAVKHGVVGMTKSTALDYCRAGIRINAVCPASIATPMTTAAVDPKSSKAQRVINAIPMGRLGTPEEVTDAILWLLSSASSFTTGAALTTDGGLSCL
eukprot:Phypoly_transcript_14739.p1 GENE.Phypoly_transcript_14739~~Phypoly_transcript_14739.p1  ORF type:complete len:258 (+),score=23.42 Phypoly_transcript_14739:99-872(+)